MGEVIPTVGVLIYRNKEEVLLVRHKKSASNLTDTYGLPAGRLKHNESEVKTAIRELNVPLILENLRAVMKQSLFGLKSMSWIIINFFQT